MTYKHKLARRLAISRKLSMVPVLLLLAACTDEATGPDAGLPQQVAATLVVPDSVTIETHQQIRFRTETARGKLVAATMSWQSSGGTITSEGIFFATKAGTYKVVGRGHGRQKPDTSTVVVVDPPPDVVKIQVTPSNPTLEVGATADFSATGVLADGSTTAVGVTWSAGGGTIDPSGVFTAGSSTGTFKVIATRTTATMADTAIVTIVAAAPTLTSVVLKPTSYSLTTGTTKQFRAYGYNSLGDSVAVQVKFSASGGTITSNGLYTAGSTAGTYRVIATANSLADTSAVTLTAPVTAPTPSPTPTTGTGLPFGQSQQFSVYGGLRSPMTMTADGYDASTIVSRLNAARSGGYKVILNLTGGPHSDYMSIIDGVDQFDESKWRAKMATYSTSTIRQAVAQAVAEGIVVGSSVMDEPYVYGTADGGGNTWGPKGTMTKARVDTLCGVVKGMFPTLAVGVAHQHNVFEPDKSYQICEFTIDQYDWRRGDVQTFRDDGLAMAQRDHMSIMFGMNVINGGVQDKDGNYTCDGAGQGGKGNREPNCRMTAQQVRDWGLLLGKAGCGLYMWRADDKFIADPAMQQTLKDLAAGLGSAPFRSCSRP